MTSRATAGRPGRGPRLFQRQNIRKPRRYQPMTVSGFTITIVSRQRDPQPSQRHPEKSVAGPKQDATPGTLALKHKHLMAQGQQLDLQVGATNGSEEDDDGGMHRPTLTHSLVTAKCSLIQSRTEFRKGQGHCGAECSARHGSRSYHFIAPRPQVPDLSR